MMEIQSNISNQERLTALVSDFYNRAGKGCLSAFIELSSGRQKRRVSEIAQITDIDEPDIMKVITSVNLVCLGSKDKAEAEQKLYGAFMKGTSGGQKTGNERTNTKIENLAIFTKIALDQNWELREKRLSAKRANLR